MTGAQRWDRVVRALANREPIAALLLDGRELAEWRARAEERGYRWLEGDRDASAEQPFRMWYGLTRPRAEDADLRRRLQEGAPSGADMDNPLLPDPAGAYDAISRWVRRLAADRPTVLVCAVDRGTRDCLAALHFVSRSLDREPVALVLLADTRDAGAPWEQTIAQLEQELGVLVPDASDRGISHRPRSGSGPVGLELGIAHCRVGALFTGTRMLVDELTAARAELGDPALLAEAWQTLAMAGLQLHDTGACVHAATTVMTLRVSTDARRRARRTAMLAMRRGEDGSGLAECFRVCERELVEGIVSPTEAAWANLDLALATSFSDAAAHVAYLDRVLAMPAERVSPCCRAVAYVWRGAAHIVQGEIELALACQENALTLLIAQEEFTRVLHVRSRVGAMMAAVGRYADAAESLQQATRDAIALGDFTLAASNAAESVSVAVAAGDPSAARIRASLADLAGWKGARVWRSPEAQLLRLRVDAQIALGEDGVEDAATLVRTLIDAAMALPPEQLDWKIRLICEASYLQSDIARAKHEPHEPWLRLGLDWAEQAAEEERAILVAAGSRRLGAAVSRPPPGTLAGQSGR